MKYSTDYENTKFQKMFETSNQISVRRLLQSTRYLTLTEKKYLSRFTNVHEEKTSKKIKYRTLKSGKCRKCSIKVY